MLDTNAISLESDDLYITNDMIYIDDYGLLFVVQFLYHVLLRYIVPIMSLHQLWCPG